MMEPSSSVLKEPKLIAESKMFGGYNMRYLHRSCSLNCDISFTVFLPGTGSSSFPVLYLLPSLYEDGVQFMRFSGAQRYAAINGIALVAPGAFSAICVNGTTDKRKNHQMYDYVVNELPNLLNDHFPQIKTSEASICGINMGGHGALTIYFKNRQKYKSVSAFTPLLNPSGLLTECLGSTKSAWLQYDLVHLIGKCKSICGPILIDQGDNDPQRDEQGLDPNFVQACNEKGIHIEYMMHNGYRGCSYAFVATFISKHISFHASFLKRT